MNWLQRLAQADASKPMALPKNPPDESRWTDDAYGRGALRIDEIMSPQTAEEQYNENMEYAGHGAFGIVYDIAPGEVIKFTKDPREAETAKMVYEQKYDWIVPMLSPPEEVQYDPFVYRLHMKKMRELSQPEYMLVNYLENKFMIENEYPEIDDVMEDFVPYLDVDMVVYIYDRMRYILDQNADTLWLTDLHGGNFGWDGKELKVWDIGPDTPYDE